MPKASTEKESKSECMFSLAVHFKRTNLKYANSLDTGIDYNHPNLGGSIGANSLVIGGYDFVGDEYDGSNDPIPDADPMDNCNGHGTHVAVRRSPFYEIDCLIHLHEGYHRCSPWK